MGELFKKASELFWGKPVLWLPVIVADLLGTAINQGQLAILKEMVIRRTEVHSALGGGVEHVRLTAAMVEQATQAATPMVWVAYFLRITLYAIALVVTAAMVQRLLERMQTSPAPADAVLARKGGILWLVVRVLAVDAVASVLLGWLGRSLLVHGHKAMAVSPWYHLAMAALVTIVLAVLVAATALRTVVGAPVSDLGASRMVMLSALLGIASQLLGLAASASIPRGRILSPGAQIALATGGSLLTAVPFILMFIAFGVQAYEERNTAAAAAFQA